MTHKAHMISHSQRGRYALTKRDEATLRAIATEYYWVQFDDGIRLLFFGLAEIRDTYMHSGFEATRAGHLVLHNIANNIQETDVN